jgi:hypothetical protein
MPVGIQPASGAGRDEEGGVAVAPLITYQTFRTRQMTEMPLGP